MLPLSRSNAVRVAMIAPESHGGGEHEAAAGRQLLRRTRSHMAAPGEQCGGGGRTSAAPLCQTWSCPGLHCLPPQPLVAQLPAGGPAVDLMGQDSCGGGGGGLRRITHADSHRLGSRSCLGCKYPQHRIVRARQIHAVPNSCSPSCRQHPGR